MGYTTEFSGAMNITPPLEPHMVEEVNNFCEQRHGGNTQPFDGMPGFWCDWEVSEDGSKIYWSGKEKSYSMDEWLSLLIRRFMHGRKVNGRMLAQGESVGDVWLLECHDNKVSCRSVLGDLEITNSRPSFRAVKGG